MSHWAHTKGFYLADPNFMKPRRIDCILGADVFACIVLDCNTGGPPETPLAQNTAKYPIVLDFDGLNESGETPRGDQLHWYLFRS